MRNERSSSVGRSGKGDVDAGAAGDQYWLACTGGGRTFTRTAAGRMHESRIKRIVTIGFEEQEAADLSEPHS